MSVVGGGLGAYRRRSAFLFNGCQITAAAVVDTEWDSCRVAATRRGSDGSAPHRLGVASLECNYMVSHLYLEEIMLAVETIDVVPAHEGRSVLMSATRFASLLSALLAICGLGLGPVLFACAIGKFPAARQPFPARRQHRDGGQRQRHNRCGHFRGRVPLGGRHHDGPRYPFKRLWCRTSGRWSGHGRQH